MKKFTLIVALLVFALLGKAEINTNLQKKVLKIKAKTDQILQKNAFLAKKSEVFKSSTHKFPVYLNVSETQKLDSMVSWSYDEESSIWKYYWKDIYKYDAQMRCTSWLDNVWNEESGTWEIWGKIEVIYDAGGKINHLLWYSSDEPTGDLFVDTKIEFFINQDEKQDSTVTYMAETDGSFTAISIQKYQYNGSGRLIQSEMWMMEEDEGGLPTGIIVKSMITKYEYNASGQITLVSNSYYIEGEEIPYSQTEYNYNSSGKLISSIYSGLNFFTFELEVSDKTEYSYNADGDIDVEIYSEWNSSNETWVELYKYENTYSNDSFSDIAFPSFFNLMYGVGDPEFMQFSKVIISDKSFDMIDGNWVQTEKANYYYSGGTTNINVLENLSVSFYPNPTSENITIKWNGSHKNLNIQIFQINGAKVLEQNAVPGEKISVTHLVKGMYLVKLLNGQKTLYAGKLIKN